MTMGCLFAISVSLLCAAEIAGAPAVQNGGFEQAEGSDALVAWGFGCSNGCQGAMAIDREIKSEGAQSVRLSSDTEQAPHVYCGLSQCIESLTPGTTYRFSLHAKGEDIGTCWFGGGPDWGTRFYFPDETFDWQEYAVTWTCPAGEHAFEFRINADSPTGSLWIDDMRVAVAPPEQQPITDPAAAEKARPGVYRTRSSAPESFS